MKYAVLVGLVSILGFGEYVFVQVMPYPPNSRVRQLEKIPIAKEFTDMWKMHRTRELIKSNSPWGYVFLLEEGQRRGDQKLIDESIEGLRNSDTFVARRQLYVYDNMTYDGGGYEWTKPLPAEYIALNILSLTENVRHPMMTDKHAADLPGMLERQQADVIRRAEEGSERYQRVLEILRENGMDV